MREDWGDWRRRCLHFHDCHVSVFGFSKPASPSLCSQSLRESHRLSVPCLLLPCSGYKWTPKQILSFIHRALNPGTCLHQSCLSLAVECVLSAAQARGGDRDTFLQPCPPQTLPKPCQLSLMQMNFQLTMCVFNLAHTVIHGQVRRAHFPFFISFFFLFFFPFPPELVNVFHLVTLTLD